jgi:hypothetical protein
MNETAVWQTVTDVGPSFLMFTMYFLHWNPGHLLGRFRLSVTTDDRSTYADGLAVGGNVTANWMVLQNLIVEGPAGMTFTNLPDDSVLAGGVVPGQGIYDVSAITNLSGITGIRLEALKDPSLPHGGGPGFAANGNFMLTEIQLAAPVPEPRTLVLMLAGLLLVGAMVRSKRRADRNRMRVHNAVVWLFGVGLSGVATATEVQLQNGTATFSQGVLGGGPYSPQMAIDGILYTGTPCCSNGWTIDHFPNNDPTQEFTANETAVWQTGSDVGPSLLTFTMSF